MTTDPENAETPGDTIDRIVIVGAGLAGAKAAEELRTQGYDGELTIVGAEPHGPYERPPLSKDLLLGNAEPDSVYVHPADWYAEHNIELVTDTSVTGVDLTARRVDLGSGTLSYDRLLLTTGARPRHLPEVDDSGAHVKYLRTIEDALALRDTLGQRLLIVGGGWIGLEVAAAARAAEGTVTVLEAAPMPLAGVLGREVAEVFVDLHRGHGVDLKLGTTIAEIDHAGDQTTVRLSDGSEVVVDLIVVGIGAVPNSDLADAAGLATDNGVTVDERLRSSDPYVFAAGDVANHDHPLLGRVRVEHWDNAIEQGRHVARAMLGDDAAYTRQPYFFTDQYDLGMEYVGHVGADGYDDVRIRGDLAERVFTAFWIKDDTVVAGMHAGDWDAIDQIREVVGGPASALPD